MPEFEAAGLRFVGRDETGTRMEIAELQGHRFFVAAQVRDVAGHQGRGSAAKACLGSRLAFLSQPE